MKEETEDLGFDIDISSKKEDSSLPSAMKTLIKNYGDIMANVGASDLEKYAEYKKYNKNPKKKRK